METRPEEETSSTTNPVMEVAKQQKRLIWLILFQVLLMILATRSASVWLIGLIMEALGAYLVYRIGRALEMSTLRLTIILVLLFVPHISCLPLPFIRDRELLLAVIGLLALLYMNGKATEFLRANGVKVGLMGANKASMRQIC